MNSVLAPRTQSRAVPSNSTYGRSIGISPNLQTSEIRPPGKPLPRISQKSTFDIFNYTQTYEHTQDGIQLNANQVIDDNKESPMTQIMSIILY